MSLPFDFNKIDKEKLKKTSADDRIQLVQDNLANLFKVYSSMTTEELSISYINRANKILKVLMLETSEMNEPQKMQLKAAKILFKEQINNNRNDLLNLYQIKRNQSTEIVEENNEQEGTELEPSENEKAAESSLIYLNVYLSELENLNQACRKHVLNFDSSTLQLKGDLRTQLNRLLVIIDDEKKKYANTVEQLNETHRLKIEKKYKFKELVENLTIEIEQSKKILEIPKDAIDRFLKTSGKDPEAIFKDLNEKYENTKSSKWTRLQKFNIKQGHVNKKDRKEQLLELTSIIVQLQEESGKNNLSEEDKMLILNLALEKIKNKITAKQGMFSFKSRLFAMCENIQKRMVTFNAGNKELPIYDKQTSEALLKAYKIGGADQFKKKKVQINNESTSYKV